MVVQGGGGKPDNNNSTHGLGLAGLPRVVVEAIPSSGYQHEGTSYGTLHWSTRVSLAASNVWGSLGSRHRIGLDQPRWQHPPY